MAQDGNIEVGVKLKVNAELGSLVTTDPFDIMIVDGSFKFALPFMGIAESTGGNAIGDDLPFPGGLPQDDGGVLE
jgi:hypothetical protein